ncbi:unnamed protein product [Sphagnum jensenii]|uniref:Uncharacterized protein n=1 Tax=Sphagnum jensenii TaxID=128206 RepID=A0ABP1BEC3_9BRYO
MDRQIIANPIPGSHLSFCASLKSPSNLSICMLEVFFSVFQLQSNGGDGSSSTFGLKWISTPHTHLGGFLFASSRRLHL